MTDQSAQENTNSAIIEILRASEARLRLITDSLPTLIAYVDSDQRYQYCNAAYRGWFGREPESLIGMHVRDLVGNDAYTNRLSYIEAALRGETMRFAGRIQHAGYESLRDTDTTYVPDIVYNSTIAGGAQVRGFCILVQDVTEQEASRREIRAKNEEIITIFESVTDAFSAFDLEWRFTYLNHEAERLLGRSREELLGKVIWDEFEDSRDTLVYPEYLRAQREQVSTVFEVYYGHLSGWFEVRAYPTPTGLSAYFRNITDRKEAENERERASEEKARLMEELQEADTKQRRFLREMLMSLTEGRLCLCESEADLPAPMSAASEPIELSGTSLRTLRRQVEEVAKTQQFSQEHTQDLLTAVGEAGMNAVVHGGGGTGQVRAENGLIQVWIQDTGAGISEESLPKALEKGMSSAGSLGHGFWLMLKTMDRIYLLTGSGGTTVVLEQNRTPPEPIWLQAMHPE